MMFMERRVLFGQVPLHLTTTRTAVLHNNSQNHAYFQVSTEPVASCASRSGIYQFQELRSSVAQWLRSLTLQRVPGSIQDRAK